MAFARIFHRMVMLDSLIRHRITGTPEELAARFGVTERTIYLYIDEFKQIGAPISYDSALKSYVYTGEFSFSEIFKSGCYPK